jgi:hypothetical protein
LTAFLFSRDDNNHHNNELAVAGNTIAAIWKRDDRLNREERSQATWRKMLYETAPAKLPAWALAPDTQRFDELGNPFGGDAVNEKIHIIKNIALTPELTPAPASKLALETSVRCLDEYREINTAKKSALEFLFTNRTGAGRVFELTLDDANNIRFPVKKVRVTVPPHSEVRQARRSSSPENRRAPVVISMQKYRTRTSPLPRRLLRAHRSRRLRRLRRLPSRCASGRL